MQSLFAYEQCKEANYLLADGHIEDKFRPDLNSMEVQDKKQLAINQKVARALFETKFKKPDTADNPDPIVNKTVKEALDLYIKSTKKDFTFLSKNMVIEVEKLSGYYYAVLGLMVALADQAATDKKINHGNFINSPWVKALDGNAELKKELSKGQWGWNGKMDKVRPWFRDVIKADNTYNEFINSKKPDIDQHKAFIKHLYRKLILTGLINEYFEEDDIRWAEDHDIVKGLVDKTIKSLDEKALTIDIQKVSLDWEDDSTFISNLFSLSANLGKDHKKLIAQNTRNWEVDRLALTDRVILEMAIAEMVHFPNIPVKVTINEYIELTKEYSTPKSRQFINGILDVISKELANAGDIKKSGRGLIDNK
ncbi:MAG TPA: transcription antitermination factor NusB [Cyclobacteriaceae bacterium]|nr:transcription antitermination factor NusB [Cyclobacteriaceae bacterium]